MRRAYAIRRPVDNAFLVRQRDRKMLRELLGFVLLTVILGGALLAYTWIHIEILRTGYRVDDLEKKLHQVEEQERFFRLELARHSHPQRIEERARKELGLREPSLDQTLFFAELAR